MKIRKIFCLGVALLITTFSTSIALAEGINSFEGDFKHYYFDYKEELPSPLKSTESGWLNGSRFVYSYRGLDNPYYSRILFDYNDTKTNYDGTTQGGVPITGETDNRFKTYEINIGKFVTKSEGYYSTDIYVYSGVGYRYWKRGLGGSVPYDEYYSWNYIPVGAHGYYKISDRLTGEVDMSARFMFQGKMQIDFTGVDPTSNKPTVDLGSRFGFKLEAPFNYELTKNLSIVFTPWYEYSGIEQSKPVELILGGESEYVYEPSSTTDQYGANLGVKLKF